MIAHFLIKKPSWKIKYDKYEEADGSTYFVKVSLKVNVTNSFTWTSRHLNMGGRALLCSPLKKTGLLTNEVWASPSPSEE